MTATIHIPAPRNPAGGTAAHAAAAAARGWAVFPCRRDGDRDRDGKPAAKRPAVAQWEQRACCDPSRVTRYWPSPRHNIGIACGPSGLVVIDLDVSPDDAAGLSGAIAPFGAQRLAAIALDLGQPWPATFTVATPSGGWHLYFLAIHGREIRNSASRIADHVDVRGAGGYIVGPGSGAGGRQYEVTDDREPVPLPPWLADLAAPPPRPVTRDVTRCVARPGSYGTAALEGEAAKVRAAGRGSRNHMLNAAAYSLGQLVPGGVLTAAQITTALLDAAESCGLLADDGQARCAATIRSGLTAGLAAPRDRVAV